MKLARNLFTDAPLPLAPNAVVLCCGFHHLNYFQNLGALRAVTRTTPGHLYI